MKIYNYGRGGFAKIESGPLLLKDERIHVCSEDYEAEIPAAKVWP